MAGKSDRAFLRNNTAYFAFVVALTTVFIACLAVQCVGTSDAVALILLFVTMIISFLMNILLGKYGFYASFALNFIQFMIYLYEMTALSQDNAAYMLAGTFTIMVINFLLQFFIVRMRTNILGEKTSRAGERHSKITRQLEEDAVTRSRLIVSHDLAPSETPYEESVTPHMDPLTTLPGREMVRDRMDKLIASDIDKMRRAKIPDEKRSAFSLICLKVTPEVSLKNQNIELFIQSLAHHIRGAADPSDMVGRVAGTEFLILTRRLMPDKVLGDYVSALCKACASAFSSSTDTIPVRTFCGISNYPDDGTNGGALITLAEDRLKEVTPGSFNYSKTSSSESPFADMSRDDIAAAFERSISDGSLYMVYQPCFTYDKKLLGFEALIRWNRGGVPVSPADFLSLAERADYIRRIGGFSLEKSLEFLAQINEINPDLTLNINVSPVQLRDTEFSESLRNAVSNSGAEPSNIILDIPEESLTTCLAQLRTLTEDLEGSGIRLALNNFGGGYSSFNTIPLLPVSILKLDSDFISDIKDNPVTRILAASTISLMHDTDIKVCATAIDTPEAFTVLAGAGCDIFQGEFLKSPMTSDEAVRFINA